MTKDMRKISRARRNNPNCHCEIWRLASTTSSAKAVRVETNKYVLAGGGVQGPGQPSEHRKDFPTVVCSLCLSHLGKGKAHHCSPKTCLMNLQQSLSPTTKDKITGSNIRERRMEGRGWRSFPRLEGGHPEQVAISLSKFVSATTPGGTRAKKRLNVGQMSHETVRAMQTAGNLGTTQAKALEHVARHGTSSRLFQANVEKIFTEQKNALKPIFEVRTHLFPAGGRGKSH